MFKLARVREKKSRDLGCVRCIKGEDGRVLVEKTEIRKDSGATCLGYLKARVSLPGGWREGFRSSI